jgi:hypothetical protein
MWITDFNPNRVTATQEFALGTVGAVAVGGIATVYKYVQYLEATAATDGVAGEVAYYYAPSGASAGSYTTVTSDLSDSAEVGAGVLQQNMSNAEYGWIQIKGPATLSIALTAGGDGDPLTPTGAGDGTLDQPTAVTDHICAYAIDASAKIILCDFPF